MNPLIAQLQQALAQSPTNLHLKSILASALLQEKAYAQAEELYVDLLSSSEHSVEAKRALITCYRHLHKNDVALVICEELIENNQASADVYFACAQLLSQQEEYADAFRRYEQAVKMDASLQNNAFEYELRSHLKPLDNNQNNTAGSTPLALSATGWNNNPDEDEVPSVDMEKPAIDFSSVGGMEQVKNEIRMKIILPLQQPELYKAYGKSIGGGILLYGPPGCGKTHIARATAGEVHATFIAVGLNDILDMWLGNSEKNLHDIFQQARRNTPCVLFFDEVDALGASRGDLRHSAMKTVINQFLEELDGVRYSNEGILIIAATNTPWHLDPALRRPGRFDRMIFVSPPDEAARESIFRIILKDKPMADIDYQSLAKKTEDYSGADIKAVIDRAVEKKLSEAMNAGKLLPLLNADMKESIRHHKPTCREWFSTAKNYALYANDGKQYDDILQYMKSRKML